MGKPGRPKIRNSYIVDVQHRVVLPEDVRKALQVGKMDRVAFQVEGRRAFVFKVNEEADY